MTLLLKPTAQVCVQSTAVRDTRVHVFPNQYFCMLSNAVGVLAICRTGLLSRWRRGEGPVAVSFYVPTNQDQEEMQHSCVKQVTARCRHDLMRGLRNTFLLRPGSERSGSYTPHSHRVTQDNSLPSYPHTHLLVQGVRESSKGTRAERPDELAARGIAVDSE